MLTIYLALTLSALAVFALVVAWFTGALARRRVERYASVGLLGRRYVTWFPVPRKQGAPVPVVLVFHDAGGSVEELEADAALHRTQAAARFAVIYPEGYHSSWNAGGCCGDALQSGIDDVKFVRAILRDLGARLAIDRRRIYATGFGNGAMLCYHLACTMSDEIAAIAPVRGGMSVEICRPTRAVPIFHLRGPDDQSSPNVAGVGDAPESLPSADDGIGFWRRVNAVHTVRHERMFGGRAECTIYTGIPSGTEIRVCTLAGIGHRWPGCVTGDHDHPDAGEAHRRTPEIDRDELNEAILHFLGNYSLPEPPRRRVSLDQNAL